MAINKYKLTVVCGRFQPLHLGHQSIIDKALMHSETVGIYVGSSNKVGTISNPFTFEERKEFLYKVYQKEMDEGRLIVKPLYDREHPSDDLSWGKYYLDCIHRDFGNPDLFVYGNDKVRNQWFTSEDLAGIDELVINRGKIDISATAIRLAILNGDRETYEQYTDSALHSLFDFMHDRLLQRWVNVSEKMPNLQDAVCCEILVRNQTGGLVSETASYDFDNHGEFHWYVLHALTPIKDEVVCWRPIKFTEK